MKNLFKLMKEELTLDLLNPHLRFDLRDDTFHESQFYPSYESGLNTERKDILFSTYHHFTMDEQKIEPDDFNEEDITKSLLKSLIKLHKRINVEIFDKDTMNYEIQIIHGTLEGNPTIEYIITTIKNH